MPNKTYAKQWLVKAYHDLSSARILYEANHYTDTTGFDLQQAIEKTLKSFLAYDNKRIKKTHNLIELYELVPEHLYLEESDIELLVIATNYYLHDRYPVANTDLPPREEIKKVLDFAQDLLERVCRILEIDISA